MRRAVVSLLVGLVLAAGMRPVVASAAGVPPDPNFPRARDAAVALNRAFPSDTAGLYRERVPPQPDDRRYS